jgi:16S rRNA (adenine1518-N6/adenine1519-N6)-dimethyltransferase
VSDGREPFARFRELMAARGFRPSKRLGQNFLLDPSLHRVIADAVALSRADCVLEIGAGLGFLTRELAARAGRVVAVEIDRRLAAILADELAALADGERVALVIADALGEGGLDAQVRAALARERAACPGRFLVVANLPYAASGPLLAELPLLVEPPDQAAVLVQLELAQRLAAVAGQREFGALSAIVGLAYAVDILRRVGPEVFRPRPAVASALVRLRRRSDSALLAVAPDARRAFAAFLRALFAQRRKQLRSVWPTALGRAGLPPRPPPAQWAGHRPEAVPGEAVLAMWREVAGMP